LGAGDLNSLFTHPRLSGSGIRHVVWTGGEPFENIESLKRGLKMAAEKGWSSEILTAGYWFRKRPGLLKTLLKNGDFSLRISIDREHLKYTLADTILSLAGECIDLDIPLNFTVRSIPGDSSGRELRNWMGERFPEYTEERKKDPRWIHRIPHVPVGSNDPYPPDGSPAAPLTGCAMVFRDLVAGWDGNFYPCCGLFSLPGFERYAVGGTGKPDIRRGRAEELFSRIQKKGPGVIREIFGSSGPEMENIDYRNNCHACLDLLRNYAEPVGRFLAGKTFR